MLSILKYITDKSPTLELFNDKFASVNEAYFAISFIEEMVSSRSSRSIIPKGIVTELEIEIQLQFPIKL